jgi:hypothetical protein
MIETNASIPERAADIPELRPPIRRRSIIREFALNTSAHALPGIARSQSNLNRLFWSLSFIIFTGVTIYFVTKPIQHYFEYPTQAVMTIVAQQIQPFPAVTICNQAPVRFDLTIAAFLAYLRSINRTAITGNTTVTEEQSQYLNDFLVSQINNGQLLDPYMFTLEDLLLSCHFNEQPCTADDFIEFQSSKYGRCFTFNAKMNLNFAFSKR